MKRTIRVKKILRVAVLLIGILIVALYILLPVGMGFFATWRFPKVIGAPPEGFVKLALTTSDGVTLASWYSPPQNGAAIILLHGATGSREGVRGYAQMLAGHGYGVLALDLRGHGESGGDGVNAYGWDGAKDVRAAVEFLSVQEDVHAIGGLGISLGGEVLLGAASELPSLQAVISDGASYRCLKEYLALPSMQSILRSFTTRVMFTSAALIGDGTPPLPITDSLSAAGQTEFLLIAAGNVEKEQAYNSLFLTCTEHAQLWVAEGASHTAAYRLNPQAYEQRVTAFFDEHL